MPLTTCVLASGSSGNSTYVASGKTRILVDSGLSCRETVRALESIGADLAGIDAVCVTHEHDDHTASLGILYRRVNMKLYANAGTIEALEQGEKLRGLPWNVFTTGAAFQIGDLRIEPFSVPHDSYDPVGFVIGCSGVRAGIVTDMGTATDLVRARLRNCQAVIIEANHEERLLREAVRPWSLKQRIAGAQGHLSNEQAAQLAVDIAGPELSVVFLAHLSVDCNRTEIAVNRVGQALANGGYGHVEVKPTYHDRASEVAVCD